VSLLDDDASEVPPVAPPAGAASTFSDDIRMIYTPDLGHPFAQRGGLSFGWNFDHSDGTPSGMSPDDVLAEVRNELPAYAEMVFIVSLGR
jgi:hypothetical protein